MDRVGCRALEVLAVLMLTGVAAATVRVTTEETRLPGDRCRRHCAEKLAGDVGGSDCPGGEQCRRVGWRPRLTGMTFSSALVMASVTWPAHGDSQYLITWELLSGGVRGHLVCSETAASLPLWPDQQYLVQVFSDGGASRPLRIDTHRSGATEETSSEAQPATPSGDVHGNVPYERAEKSWPSATISSGGGSASSFARVPELVRRISEMASVAVPVAAALGVKRTGPVPGGRGTDESRLLQSDTTLSEISNDLGPVVSPVSVATEARRLSLPLLSLLVVLPLLLLLLMMMMGAAAVAVRSRLNPQREQRQTSGARADQRVLPGLPVSSWRPRTLPRALGDRNCEPSFITPVHKR